MNKKKKPFEPIRRGAPSLPFDFTEPLKEIKKEEIENINKFIEDCKQKMIDITGIPKEYYKECKQKMIETSGILKEYYKSASLNKDA